MVGLSGAPTRLLVTSTSRPTFVQRDLDALQESFEVTYFEWHGARDLLGLRRAVRSCDVALAWFAAPYTAALVRFAGGRRVPVAIIVGGYEVASDRELGYGTRAGPWHARLLTKYALEHADRLLPVSSFTLGETRDWVRPKAIEVLHHGLRASTVPKGPKDGSIVTVAGVTDRTYRLKGVDTFVAAARALPAKKFTIIGPKDEALAARLGQGVPNVEFTGALPEEALRERLGRASVYCQLSRRESFGVALLEGMAAGCVPVVSNRGALPDVVGDVGHVVPYGDVDETVGAITTALADQGAGARANARAVETFAWEKRARRLTEILHSMATKATP